MVSPEDSTSNHELLRILGVLPNRLAFMLPDSRVSTRIRWPTQAALGTTTDSPVIWLSVTRIGSVQSGLPGAGSMVVEVILSITECVDSPARRVPASVDN